MFVVAFILNLIKQCGSIDGLRFDPVAADPVDRFQGERLGAQGGGAGHERALLFRSVLGAGGWQRPHPPCPSTGIFAAIVLGSPCGSASAFRARPLSHPLNRPMAANQPSANGSRKPLRSPLTRPQGHSRPRRGGPRDSMHHPDSSGTRSVQPSSPFCSLGPPSASSTTRGSIRSSILTSSVASVNLALPALLSYRQTTGTPLETPTSSASNPLA